ncbi:MAG: helix-turn-helix domain-containing protein [bacterium]
MDEIKETITENIKYFRKKMDVSQEKLSEMCGYSSTYIGKIERGQRSPSLDTLIRISEALQIPLNSLFDPFYQQQGRMRSDWDPSAFTPYDTTFRRFNYLVGTLNVDGEIMSIRHLPWFHSNQEKNELEGIHFLEYVTVSSRCEQKIEDALATTAGGDATHLNLVTSESKNLERTTDLVFLPPSETGKESGEVSFELFYPRIIRKGQPIPLEELFFELAD